MYVEIIKHGLVGEGADQKNDEMINEKSEENSEDKTDESVVDISDITITDRDNTESMIRKYILKSYHMFP